ncbi:MAG: hypothetical protein HC905_03555 [Bacteroidales bacterium]|nr:hypothetical protein [Bacteroidales bacterium]
MIWLNKDIGPVLLDKEVIKAFELKSYDTLFRFIKYKTKLLNDTSSFYQVLIDNNVKLLALRKAIKVSEYYVRNTQYSVFTQSSQFVLLVNQKEYVISNFKRKTIINLFPDKEDKIKDFLKHYPFKIRTETDLMHFIDAISGILTE